jgi:hypothetical protein
MMAEKSITCDTFDQPDAPGAAVHRTSPDMTFNGVAPVMESRRHCKDFFGHYASQICTVSDTHMDESVICCAVDNLQVGRHVYIVNF